MLKNESAWNATKTVPLRPSRLPNSDGIFTLSNGLYMSKISRSVRKVKQAKENADCAVRTVCTDADVACPYTDMESPYRRHMAAPRDDTCQADLDVWVYSWTNPEVTRVTTERVTRDTSDVSS
jgi:hypothetical protein